MATEVKKGMCLTCLSFHGMTFTVEDGKIVEVRRDKETPFRDGPLCTKGEATPEIVSSPERVLYPMKRVGARGEGKWQRISWDEAYDTIADNLKKVKSQHGPEAITLSGGWSTMFVVYLQDAFLARLGSPNLLYGYHI